MNWITTDELGVIAFATRKAASEAAPSFRQVRCTFAMGFRGWLAMDPYGSDNGSTIQTPDGRKIPVVMGWSESGKVCGMRGGIPRVIFSDIWRTIMSRAIEAGLSVHAYRNGY